MDELSSISASAAATPAVAAPYVDTKTTADPKGSQMPS